MSSDKPKGNKKVEYGARAIRMSDSTYAKFKEARKKSGDTWNKFILKLIKSL